MPENLLIVVDVINGFINQGPLSDPKISKIIPHVIAEIEKALNNSHPIIAFIDAHEIDAIEFETFPVHCLKGSVESKLVPELMPYQEKMHLIEKNSTNGFFTTEFQPYLDNKYQEIIIVGCCTDICVLQLALTLKTYFNQNNINQLITVINQATATFDLPHHNADLYHEMAINLLSQAGINIKGEN